MNDEKSKLDEASAKLQWKLAVESEKPIVLSARDVELLLSTILLNQTVTFRLAEAISRMHAGDMAASQASVNAAIDTNTRSLELAKQLYADLTRSVQPDGKNADG
ncbi:hypothetical protein [Ciceribacter azotifigens]|uniref:hypothetical protein n=1 Tax=Ciceribacter azotifigens TaxID=2069303 RepID=UPI003A8B7AE8